MRAQLRTREGRIDSGVSLLLVRCNSHTPGAVAMTPVAVQRVAPTASCQAPVAAAVVTTAAAVAARFVVVVAAASLRPPRRTS